MGTFRKNTLSLSRNVILYVDRKVVVINKPPGMVSQAAVASDLHFRDENTSLQPEGMLGKMLNDINTILGLGSRPLPVHRLDKPTTGALLLARTPQAAKDFSQQFKTGLVHKKYLALVRGGRKTFATESGEINTRLNVEDGRVFLSDHGKDAHTSWELLDSSLNAPLSLLRLTLHTGLKHQLRVHAAHILNAPILGDDLYSRSEVSAKIKSAFSLPEGRMFLHASQISFLRYRAWGQAKQYRLGIIAPLPKDFVDICIEAGISLDRHATQGGVTIDGQYAPEDLSDIQGQWVGPRPH